AAPPPPPPCPYTTLFRSCGQRQQRVARPDPLIERARLLRLPGRGHGERHEQEIPVASEVAPFGHRIESLAERDGPNALRGEPGPRPEQPVAAVLDGRRKRDAARARRRMAHEELGGEEQRTDRARERDQPLTHARGPLPAAPAPAPAAPRGAPVRARSPPRVCSSSPAGPRSAPARRSWPAPASPRDPTPRAAVQRASARAP